MDGQLGRRFFLDPQLTFQRRYEALRAVIAEDRPVTEVAAKFGYKPAALNVMISRFNSQLRRGGSPLFLADGRGRPPGQRRCEDLNGPEEPAIADQRELDLESGRSLQTRNAGIFLFLPLLVKLRFDRMATDAGYPGSKMVPASRALLALLMLKLLDKERRGHINDFNFDEALGLFAGLNVLPKKSFATDYS